jgi:hypothetical protein
MLLRGTIIEKDNAGDGSSSYLVRLDEPLAARGESIDRLLLTRRHRENWASLLSRYSAAHVSMFAEGKPTAAPSACAIATIKRA